MRLCLLAALLCACQAQPSRPNVVLIFTDDLGYGDLATYGHPLIATPHLDRMAAQGVRFTSFYTAAPVCTPSRAALLTGRYPIRHLPGNLGPESTTGLPPEEVTLAEVLAAEGYRTKAVGKWHLGHLPEFLPTRQGFDEFVGLPYSNDMLLPWCPWLTEEDELHLYRGDAPAELVNYEQAHLTELFTREAVGFIEESAGEPFFLYLAHPMPHLPISASQDFRGRSQAGLYGDVIEALDWSVGEVLRTLEERGLDGNTLVIFTSDNGPWHELPDRMLQRGVERWHTGSTGPLRGAKGTTWEGGMRVPAIVRWPGVLAEGATVREVATTLDLFPTIAAATGAALPERELDGSNLLPRLAGEESWERDPFYYYRGDHLRAVRRGPWKLSLVEDGKPELHHLDRDPGEKYDESAAHPGVAAELYESMRAFADTNGGIVSALQLAR